MSDLERRVAELERRVARAGGRVDALGLANGRAGVRLRMVRGLAAAAAGGPPVTVPCCPGVNLPASLTVGLPDGTTATLAHAGGIWEGQASVEADVFDAWPAGACSILSAVPSRRPHPVYFRLSCGSIGLGPAFFLETLTPAGVRFVPPASQEYLPARTSPSAYGDALCRRGAYTFSPVGGTRVCRPFNAAFRILSVNLPGLPFAANQSVVVYG